MAKSYPVPCTKEEMNALLEASLDSDYYYTLFFIAKTTGRRLGEFYGTPEKKVISVEKYTDEDGKTHKKRTYKTTGQYIGGVRVKDIDFDKKIMNCQVLKRRKRMIKEALLTDEACRLLKQYIMKKSFNENDFIFRVVSYRQIQNAVPAYAKKAGIEHPVSFHNFRHYFITEMIKIGFSYDQVAKLTGHGNIATIGGYDHTIASDIRPKAIEAIKNL